MRNRLVPIDMNLKVIGLLLLVPLVDALLLVVWASLLSWPLIVLVVVLTALVGMLLVRAEGRHTIRKIQHKLAVGEPPTDELVDGALLIAAGAFLLTPGLVTDAVGFLLAIPLTRWPIRTFLKGRLSGYVDVRSGGFASGDVYTAGFPFGQDDVPNQGGDPTDDTFDVDPDAYNIDIEDDDTDSSSA